MQGADGARLRFEELISQMPVWIGHNGVRCLLNIL